MFWRKPAYGSAGGSIQGILQTGRAFLGNMAPGSDKRLEKGAQEAQVRFWRQNKCSGKIAA